MFRRLGLAQRAQQLAAQSMQFGLAPARLRDLHEAGRFAELPQAILGPPRLGESLAEKRQGEGQEEKGVRRPAKLDALLEQGQPGVLACDRQAPAAEQRSRRAEQDEAVLGGEPEQLVGTVDQRLPLPAAPITDE